MGFRISLKTCETRNCTRDACTHALRYGMLGTLCPCKSDHVLGGAAELVVPAAHTNRPVGHERVLGRWQKGTGGSRTDG